MLKIKFGRTSLEERETGIEITVTFLCPKLSSLHAKCPRFLNNICGLFQI